MIVTFYSYKGGVGRSMALANIAVVLMRRGLRVLMVDWDLEAPGLENYFSYFKVEVDRPGLLAMLIDARRGEVDYRGYLSTIASEGGELSLLASGRATDIHYSANLERFDWPAFFRGGGGDFLESTRERWREDFDFVLIDSRTGLSDSGGICTIQMPDILVGMFTANHQSLYGVRDVMRLAQNARHSLAYDRAQLSIIPVCTRFGNDFRESQNWLDRTSEAMGEFYRDWVPSWAKPREIAEHLKIPQIDYFGYGEKLAVMEQGGSDPQGMGFAYEKIANLLAADLCNADEVFNLKRPSDAPEPRSRTTKSARAEPASGEYEFDCYVSYEQSSSVEQWLRPFVERLRKLVSVRLGRDASFFFDFREVVQGTSWDTTHRNALSRSRLLLAVATHRYFQSRFAVAEWKTFEAREKLSGETLIMPILATGVGTGAPSWFRERLHFDARAFFMERTTTPDPAGEQRELEFLSNLAFAMAREISSSPDLREFPIVLPEEVEIERVPPKLGLGSGRAEAQYR